METGWLIVACSVSALAGLVGGISLCAAARRRAAPEIYRLLLRHFAPVSLNSVTVTERQFPATVRADLQQTLERYLAEHANVKQLVGVRSEESAFFGVSLAAVLSEGTKAVGVALEYDQVNVGEAEPVRCLVNALWLLEADGCKYAVLLSRVNNFHTAPTVRIAVAGTFESSSGRFATELFQALETSVRCARSYRGKVLSFAPAESYTGEETGITVHKVPRVAREEVVLPASTLELVERNVLQFVRQRSALAALGQPLRKGLLFHGSPGNGKTHTIHYLIGELEGHTTVLLTAEQVGSLSQYMSLARLLQPSLVILEDVDLIARDRSHHDSPCQESLLNRLLNEMDGFAGDAEIIFLLTTNRPEALEDALAARPGRIDQAIEFPMPDSEGRRKLVRLYAGPVDLAPDVVDQIVDRTEGVSAAFIKELMRRTLQFHLARNSHEVVRDDVLSALDELVVHGGRLNRRVVGFADAGSHDRSEEDLQSVQARGPAKPR